MFVYIPLHTIMYSNFWTSWKMIDIKWFWYSHIYVIRWVRKSTLSFWLRYPVWGRKLVISVCVWDLFWSHVLFADILATFRDIFFFSFQWNSKLWSYKNVLQRCCSNFTRVYPLKSPKKTYCSPSIHKFSWNIGKDKIGLKTVINYITVEE